jgi:hypothetical protein
MFIAMCASQKVDAQSMGCVHMQKKGLPLMDGGALVIFEAMKNIIGSRKNMGMIGCEMNSQS